MRRILFALLLLVVAGLPAFCGDEQFNGRWDIKTGGERPRAWWLEIEGAGTPTPKGKFVSAFAGDLNVIEEIAINNGELRFGWKRTERPREGGEPTTRHLVYTARLVNGKIEGSFQVEGSSQPPLQFSGARPGHRR